MITRPPRYTRTDTLFPYTTLFRSVERKIVRIVTPGMLTDEALLPAKADRMIAAVWTNRVNRSERAGLAWMNLANGEFRVCECTPEMLDTEQIGRAHV